MTFSLGRGRLGCAHTETRRPIAWATAETPARAILADPTRDRPRGGRDEGTREGGKAPSPRSSPSE